MKSKPQFIDKEAIALQTAYEQAIYEVYTECQTIQFRIGDRCLKIDSLLDRQNYRTWALITAYNPYSQCLSETENQQRYCKLIYCLKSLQLTYLNAVGKDPGGVWQPELSLFVLGVERELAIAIGQQFQQNAIVYGVWQQPVHLIWL